MPTLAVARIVNRFRDLPLHLKGLALIAIPLVGMLAVVVTFYFAQRATQEAEMAVTHTLEVRSQVQAVHTRLEEAETGMLGHLLTRDPTWLEPFKAVEQELPGVLNRLESMIGDNTAQLERVRMIRMLIGRQMEIFRSLPVRVPAGVGFHPALVDSRRRLDVIRGLLDETRVAEDRILEQRRSHAETVWARGYAVIAAGILFVPLAAIVATLLFTSGVARRIEALDDSSHRLAEGKPVTIAPSGADEIGRLERSLSETAALLARRESELRRSRDELEMRVDARTSELAEANRALGAEVAERKVAEDEVADVNRRLQAVIDASPLAIIRVDLEDNVVNWNRAAERIFGWKQDEVLTRPLPQIPDEASSPFRELLAGEDGRAPLVGHETRRRRKDGKMVDLRVWTAPLRSAAGGIRGNIAIVADFTEQVQLEQQLTQAQKMEAIGRLAGGVAHDFNNVITIISGYGHMLLEGNRDKPDLREAASEVLKASERAATLAGQLLAFSRRQVIQPKLLDLNTVVRDVERMLTRVIGEDIELRTVLDPEAGVVRADPGQLEQVLLNLVVNARDAMPGGGKLTLETANVNLGEAYARIHAGVAAGPYVMLSVTDTGMGMDAETRAHMYEPFFTTKERGKGTGLGLSTVYGIVKQHGGDIWVYSEPGKGTTFKIYLPRVGTMAVAVEPKAVAPSPSGTETVLLVEDESGVRKLIRDVLDQHGYRVLEAGSGAAALETSEAHEGPIDLLVTDLVMPGMNGRDLAEALALLRPEMKVLYLSGYTAQGTIDQSAQFLEKPFSPETLARKIRDVLDNQSRAA